MAANKYDAFLLVSFGGPEKREDVIPFLENVLRGRNVPRERLEAVAEHYYHFGGVSPINEQCRKLIEALRPLLPMPIYWGNRNWQPMLADTVAQMRADGVKHALALATSAFGSYSGCRQYREDIERVQGDLRIDKLPPFSDRPGFREAVADRVREALEKLPGAEIVYTAHSIPVAMAQAGPYVEQLTAVAGRDMVYQSRSGPPSQPWLEPDILDYIRKTSAKKLIVVPLGFLSDHMEVLYDLDTEAAELAKELGIEMVRAGTVGTHPAFVKAIAEMVAEGPAYQCAPDCCKLPPAPSKPATGGRPTA